MTIATMPKSAAAGLEATSESRIDRDSHFNGLYETKQDLRIEGVAEGEIQCEGTLTVAEGARVKAKVTAKTITIAGELEGEVICRGVFQILPTGQVEASVSACRLIVQEGGLYNGDFHMITDEPGSYARAAVESTPRDDASKSVETPLIGSDDWWSKFSGEQPRSVDGETEPT